MSRNFIVPFGSARRLRALFATGMAVAGPDAQFGKLLLLGLTPVAINHGLSSGAQAIQELRTALDALQRKYSNVEMLSTGLVTQDAWADIHHIVSARMLPDDFLLLPWGGHQPYLGIDLGQALRQPPCDIAVVHKPETRRKIKRILLPLRGGSYIGLGAQIAVQLAHVHDAEITLLHVVPAGSLGPNGPRSPRGPGFSAVTGPLTVSPNRSAW